LLVSNIAQLVAEWWVQVFWDNRSLIHSRTPSKIYDAGGDTQDTGAPTRLMHRICLKSNYEVSPADVRRIPGPAKM
jgi:hypothetical protein